MHFDLIIRNGTIVTSSESFLGDVAVKGGKIAKVGILESTDTADEIYDASGKHVLPGIIDAHVHFRDPGLTQKEDFETGSIAAAFGGVTMIADMPNVDPVTSTAERFIEKINVARQKSYVDFALFALLNNDNLNEIEGLKKSGALGFKVYFGSSTGDIAAPSFPVLTKQMDECAKLGIRIGFHAELNEVNANFTTIAKTEADSPDGFWLDYARPVLSEVKALQTIIGYAYHTKAKIHIHHLTSEDGVILVQQAREKEIDISTEVCPHYLIFNCQEDTHKVFPPIRDESHQSALWDAISNKVIDILASDHAPHTVDEKNLPLWDAPAGLTGVETFISIMLNEINKGKLSINDFVRLASEAPAKLWGIYPRKGNLLQGGDADITIVDMNKSKVIRASELHSKNKTSAYDGMEVKGCPAATIVRGSFVMKDGRLTGKKGYGVFVNPELS